MLCERSGQIVCARAHSFPRRMAHVKREHDRVKQVQAQRHPVGRILESCHVQDEHLVAAAVVAPDWRKVLVTAAADALHEHTEFGLREAVKVARVYASTVAACQASCLCQRNALMLDQVQRPAAVQHALVEPSPWAFPCSTRVNGQCVEDHAEACQTTKCRLFLRDELFHQLCSGI
eukprot:366485-Chlamydomonas_euryale.AAC.25